MKKILSAGAVALVFAVTAGAQTTPSTASQSQPASPSAGHHQSPSKAHKMSSKASIVTLTGCLRQGENPNSFKLENAQMTGTASSSAEQQGSSSGSNVSTSASATSGSGTSTGMSAGMSGTDMGSVTLMANADIDLKDHVGHKVEVRGTMVPSKSGKAHGTMTRDKGTATSDTMGSASGASSTSATGTSGSNQESAHALKVRGFQHISDSCSQ